MSVIRGIMVGLVGAALIFALIVGQPTSVIEAIQRLSSQVPTTLASTAALAQPQSPEVAAVADDADAVIWGRVPYCTCLTTSATANVASALQAADLSVSLKELSPTDGWLYFVASYNPDSVTSEQVSEAMLTGGAEILDGPP